MFDLSVKLSKKNDELERNILAFQNHIKALESENDNISDEMNTLRRQDLKINKCETCDSLRNEIENLHETLSKFTQGKQNLDMILSNQTTLYNKVGLSSQPNKIMPNIL